MSAERKQHLIETYCGTCLSKDRKLSSLKVKCIYEQLTIKLHSTSALKERKTVFKLSIPSISPNLDGTTEILAKPDAAAEQKSKESISNIKKSQKIKKNNTCSPKLTSNCQTLAFQYSESFHPSTTSTVTSAQVETDTAKVTEDKKSAIPIPIDNKNQVIDTQNEETDDYDDVVWISNDEDEMSSPATKKNETNTGPSSNLVSLDHRDIPKGHNSIIMEIIDLTSQNKIDTRTRNPKTVPIKSSLAQLYPVKAKITEDSKQRFKNNIRVLLNDKKQVNNTDDEATEDVDVIMMSYDKYKTSTPAIEKNETTTGQTSNPAPLDQLETLEGQNSQTISKEKRLQIINVLKTKSFQTELKKFQAKLKLCIPPVPPRSFTKQTDIPLGASLLRGEQKHKSPEDNVTKGTNQIDNDLIDTTKDVPNADANNIGNRSGLKILNNVLLASTELKRKVTDTVETGHVKNVKTAAGNISKNIQVDSSNGRKPIYFIKAAPPPLVRQADATLTIKASQRQQSEKSPDDTNTNQITNDTGCNRVQDDLNTTVDEPHPANINDIEETSDSQIVNNTLTTSTEMKSETKTEQIRRLEKVKKVKRLLSKNSQGDVLGNITRKPICFIKTPQPLVRRTDARVLSPCQAGINQKSLEDNTNTNKTTNETKHDKVRDNLTNTTEDEPHIASTSNTSSIKNVNKLLPISEFLLKKKETDIVEMPKNKHKVEMRQTENAQNNDTINRKVDVMQAHSPYQGVQEPSHEDVTTNSNKITNDTKNTELGNDLTHTIESSEDENDVGNTNNMDDENGLNIENVQLAYPTFKTTSINQITNITKYVKVRDDLTNTIKEKPHVANSKNDGNVNSLEIINTILPNSTKLKNNETDTELAGKFKTLRNENSQDNVSNGRKPIYFMKTIPLPPPLIRRPGTAHAPNPSQGQISPKDDINTNQIAINNIPEDEIDTANTNIEDECRLKNVNEQSFAHPVLEVTSTNRSKHDTKYINARDDLTNNTEDEPYIANTNESSKVLKKANAPSPPPPSLSPSANLQSSEANTIPKGNFENLRRVQMLQRAYSQDNVSNGRKTINIICTRTGHPKIINEATPPPLLIRQPDATHAINPCQGEHTQKIPEDDVNTNTKCYIKVRDDLTKPTEDKSQIANSTNIGIENKTVNKIFQSSTELKNNETQISRCQNDKKHEKLQSENSKFTETVSGGRKTIYFVKSAPPYLIRRVTVYNQSQMSSKDDISTKQISKYSKHVQVHDDSTDTSRVRDKLNDIADDENITNTNDIENESDSKIENTALPISTKTKKTETNTEQLVNLKNTTKRKDEMLQNDNSLNNVDDTISRREIDASEALLPCQDGQESSPEDVINTNQSLKESILKVTSTNQITTETKYIKVRNDLASKTDDDSHIANTKIIGDECDFEVNAFLPTELKNDTETELKIENMTDDETDAANANNIEGESGLKIVNVRSLAFPALKVTSSPNANANMALNDQSIMTRPEKNILAVDSINQITNNTKYIRVRKDLTNNWDDDSRIANTKNIGNENGFESVNPFLSTELKHETEQIEDLYTNQFTNDNLTYDETDTTNANDIVDESGLKIVNVQSLAYPVVKVTSGPKPGTRATYNYEPVMTRSKSSKMRSQGNVEPNDNVLARNIEYEDMTILRENERYSEMYQKAKFKYNRRVFGNKDKELFMKKKMNHEEESTSNAVRNKKRNGSKVIKTRGRRVDEVGHRPSYPRKAKNMAENKNRRHKKPARAVKCNICKKTYKSIYFLNRHKLVHTEVKSNQCQYCDYMFMRKIDLKIHCRKIHKDKLMPDTATTGRITTDTETTDFTTTDTGTTEKNIYTETTYNKTTDTKLMPYHCPFCNWKFMRSDDLGAHFWYIHTDKLTPFNRAIYKTQDNQQQTTKSTTDTRTTGTTTTEKMMDTETTDSDRTYMSGDSDNELKSDTDTASEDESRPRFQKI
ncbi:uncharacterized protein LOC126379354 isoform X2 [Pectinophora gossypiella]|uniref:uncharacterized protein LOC126379354 isoform X2 n=1 Tax=Pectinophora gossypiella TaxID=13191 RepID=UPI00214F1D5A|nr:uncharacterized protein LOC126379354 isoform X2 [Pectinophora gossypiella]